MSCGCRRRLSSTEISYKRNAAGTVWHNTPIPTYPPTHPRSASLSLQGPHSPDETVNIQPFNAESFHQLCRYTGKENA